MWNILCYVSHSGRNEIQKKYDASTPTVQAGLTVSLEYLRIRAKPDWQRPAAAKLTKCSKFRDFYEIRFFAENTQQRPIGYFGPGENDFTILVWAIEKGRLIPEGWCDEAYAKMQKIQSGSFSVTKLLI